MSIYCTACGNEMESGASFCTKCGAKMQYPNKNKRYVTNESAKTDKKKSYTLHDLGKQGIKGSYAALIGLVIGILGFLAGETGMLCSIIAIFLLFIGRVRGFKSVWVTIGVIIACLVFVKASSQFIARIEYENAVRDSMFFSNMLGVLGLFF